MHVRRFATTACATLGVALSLVLGVFTAAAAQETVRGARHPALSPDGRWLAFSWRGDLWKVSAAGGRADRLTVHPGDDRLPQWSPDGRWIAYSSKRDGNYDVFIAAADGGSTRQLTFHSANDLVLGWSADGAAVLFSSARDFDRGVLWSVPVAGGTERKVTRGQTATASVSTDGRTLLVAAGGAAAWWRKGYRGSNNWAIWSRPMDRMGQATRLTTFNGRNGWPSFSADNRAIYFLSDSTGATELWRMNADGSSKEALTHLGHDGARFLSVARAAPLAAYELDASLYTIALPTGAATDGRVGTPQEVRITAASDEQFNNIARMTFSDRATDADLSPDARELALVVRGDVFVTSTRAGGSTENLTNNFGRDLDASWSADNRSLVFVSDRAGNEDIYLIRSADSTEPRLSRTLRTTTTQLTREPTRETNPGFSPDGRKIAFLRSGDPPSLWVMDAGGANATKLVEGYVNNYAWSPDGRWIAYVQQHNYPTGSGGTDIFIIPAAGGTAVNVTNYPAGNRSPAWSRDGRRLAFVSTRGPGEGNSDVYQIWLRRADEERTREDWAMEEDRGSRERGAGPSGAGDSVGGAAAGPRTPPNVQIDFDGIQDRAHRVTEAMRVQSFGFSPDGRQYLLVANVAGQTELWTVGRDGEGANRITRGMGGGAGGGAGGGGGGIVGYEPDGRRIYYRTGRGTIGTVEPSGQNPGSVSFTANVTVDRAAESVQMFEEAWRSLGARFYDPRMHGHDWNAVHATYRPLAEAAYTKEALGDVLLMMIGELNASHLNYTVAPEPDAVRTGELGVVFDDAYRGRGLRIAAVTPGSPADHVASHLAAGEYLIAVGDANIMDTTNVYRLLNSTVGDRIAITVGPSADGRGARVIGIRPASTGELGDLQYDAWVARNHQRVQQLSNGRIGYLHIRAMDQPSLERFKRDLWGREAGEDAVIIDQRYNGGGNIHEQLWTELARRAPIYFTNRAGERRFSPQTWTRPSVVLQNQNSASDAEIFPYGFKALGFGRTIGVPTGAAVIGTQDINLIDGSVFRLPGSGVYAVQGDRNLENWGIEPDIWVENPFEQEHLGSDLQLERAVQELMTAVGVGR
jgi:tricorn protease